jgi:hypothetical protein
MNKTFAQVVMALNKGQSVAPLLKLWGENFLLILAHPVFIM